MTVDWLLSDEEPVEEESENIYGYQREQRYTETGYADSGHGTSGNYNTDWVDKIPGTIGKLVKRFGWLAGVYMAVVGSMFAFMGWLMRFISQRMFSSFDNTVDNMLDGFGGFGGMGYYDDSFAGFVSNSVSGMAANNPVSIMGGIVLVLGIVLIIVGVVLAVVLKKKSAEG